MRSPLFLFAVIVLICVCFVMVIGMMISQTPTAGNYTVSGSPENATQGLINTALEGAPNYMIPGIFVVMALTLITFLLMLGRKR